ncbi:L-sorbosone dehydrogenase [Fusarium agapanthi]|uniref:L-sorbosone dehydrogenase n=1 Tax=Fusarium agapanthi TaxID=1803897 RepID=A0A9P5E4W7_9HYPO|nr:L-sorbosone dehydrogenase [Fusarium agapanthi]
MTSLRLIAAIALISTFITSFASAQQCSYKQHKPRRSKPIAAAGWEYSVVHNSFRQPRTILFDTEGALLVLDSITGIVHLKLDDSDAGGRCVRLAKKTTLLKKISLNHGLALSKDGRTIYASSSNSVWSYSYDPKTATLDQSSEQMVVDNMASDGHTWRSLLMSQKSPDMLIVSRGSGLGGDPQAETLSSGHAQIRVFNISAFDSKSPDDPEVKPHDFAQGGARLGWGLRNAQGLAEHPVTGGIFSTENSYEVLHRDGKDISVDNPGDEMNFHGTLNGSSESTGGNYGYPFCYSVWSIEKFPRRDNVKIGEQFGADRSSEHSRRTDVECVRDYVAPVQVFQAQSAPIGLEFNQDGTRAYVAFHGSWNRFKPVGYEVGYIDFKKGQPAMAAIESRNAAKPILSNDNMVRCGEDCFRPVSLAVDKKNRLFFSSDTTRDIFVLYNNSTTP